MIWIEIKRPSIFSKSLELITNIRDFPNVRLFYSEGVARAFLGDHLIAESDGMSFLCIQGERLVVRQKWCRLVGLKGVNGKINFDWSCPSGRDNWGVGLNFWPQEEKGMVRFYQTMGFNFHMPCRVETQSENIDYYILLACAIFFWTYAEHERSSST